MTLKTLAASAPGIVGDVKTVHLLGVSEALPFTRTADGLVVTLPAQKTGDHAWALKITGIDLAASEPVAMTGTTPIKADTDGSFTLGAGKADVEGGQIQVEHDGANIGYWDNAADTAAWTLDIAQPGSYTVTANYAAPAASELVIEAGGQTLDAKLAATGAFETYQPLSLGALQIKQTGPVVLKARPRDAATWTAINLASLKLTPVK